MSGSPWARSKGPLAAWALGPILGLVGSSCVQLEWTKLREGEPLRPGAIERIEAGMDAGQVFAALGAPTAVGVGEAGDVVIVYNLVSRRDWGISGSVSVDDSLLSPSFAYGDAQRLDRGVWVLLDGNLAVRELRFGALSVPRFGARTYPEDPAEG